MMAVKAWIMLRIGAFLAGIALPSIMLIASACFDIRDYLTDQGVTGPYTCAQMPDGKCAAGVPTKQIAAGERFTWISTLCLGPSTVMEGRVELWRSGSPTESYGTIRRFGAQERCGPLTGSIVVPPTARPGRYEVRRYATVRFGSIWPLTKKLESVWVDVTEPLQAP